MTDTSQALTRRTRRESRSANRHMSREAVSVSVPELLQATDRQCLDMLVEVRFGSWDTHHLPIQR
jgi:hypothetical protein